MRKMHAGNARSWEEIDHSSSELYGTWRWASIPPSPINERSPYKNLLKTMKTETGFTLVELMSVVAIVAILSAVALPSYNAYVIRGKLSEGASALSDGRVKMEQFFQDNRSYNSATLAANGCPTTLPFPATTTYFSYSC